MFCSNRLSLCILPFLAAACFAVSLTPAFSATDKALEVLKENGLTADAESLGDYLDSLHPDSNTTQHVKKLIAQLGDADFFVREAALQELIRKPLHSSALLQQAIDGNDPEVAWRAKQVLKLANGRTGRLLYAVFSIIETQKITGLAEAIIKAFPYCENEYLKARAAQALTATVTAADAGLLLQTALAADADLPPEESLRVAAVEALESVSGKSAEQSFLKLTGNSEPDPVRLAAARALANQGSRSALTALISLLESETPEIRTTSVHVLRTFTGQNFEFMAYDEPKIRSLKALAWKRWLEDDSPTAVLRFPLNDVALNFGRTLFANYTQNKVYETDAQGKVVWEQEVSGVWAVKGLPNGHRLISSYTAKFLVEYDASGKEIWKFEDLPNKPYSVQRLPNGNTLVPVYGNEILEIRPDKSFARRIRVPETVKWAEQLENGRILVVFYTTGRIAELDDQGSILWEVGGMGNPYSVERLANGNTLVANRRNNKVVEVDREGNMVWSYDAAPSLYRAQRLPDGNTLVVSSGGAVEVDAGGEVVWQKNENGLRGIDRY
jgi:HEAT repeat protein